MSSNATRFNELLSAYLDAQLAPGQEAELLTLLQGAWWRQACRS